jgi:hypothetical protein
MLAQLLNLLNKKRPAPRKPPGDASPFSKKIRILAVKNGESLGIYQGNPNAKIVEMIIF